MSPKSYFSLYLIFIGFNLYPISMKIIPTTLSDHQKNIVFNVTLNPEEKILKQTIHVSLDSPHAQLSPISFDPAPTKKYLSEFSDTKEIFDTNFTMMVPVSTSLDNPVQAHLHVSFLLLPDNKMSEQLYRVSFNENSTENADLDVNDRAEHVQTTSTSNFIQKKSLTEKFQDMVQTTNSLWLKLFFAFLLGLLLSLTPCIYPMIPITIGILHGSGKNSLFYNFLGSMCYAFGLSTTFSCLGLLAAFAGASFGSLLSQPLFVIVLICFIGYMSLTMIGIIDLKIPSFLQRNTHLTSAFGPFVAAYLFGLISGSVASPCVSPGLALLLTIVATMGNIAAGFLLLFCFGIGLSIPLIIIGTFSSSMYLLPQAGQWMVEIKKLLGFLMLGTCLYYLSNIVSSMVLSWFIIIYLLFAALFYIIDAQKDFDKKTKTLKSLLGIILLALCVVLTFKSYENINYQDDLQQEEGVTWASSYAQALADGKAENKLLILDFWANHCTICKAIDKKLFHKNYVAQALKHNFIFVKVDCTNNNNPESAMLKNKFQIFAQPAILVINPETETVMKKWSSEPYSMTPEQFVTTVHNVK